MGILPYFSRTPGSFLYSLKLLCFCYTPANREGAPFFRHESLHFRGRIFGSQHFPTSSILERAGGGVSNIFGKTSCRLFLGFQIHKFHGRRFPLFNPAGVQRSGKISAGLYALLHKASSIASRREVRKCTSGSPPPPSVSDF